MRNLLTLLVSACFALTPVLPAPSVAQEPFVIVPDHPQGVPVNGCYRANQTLFGPYQFNFCLTRPGSYTVRGGGVRCDGRLTWRASGRNIDINLRRQSCNRGVAWAAARVDCRASSVVRDILDQIFGRNQRVVVPDLPAVRTLTCTYFPTVRGERPANFTARRT